LSNIHLKCVSNNAVTYEKISQTLTHIREFHESRYKEEKEDIEIQIEEPEPEPEAGMPVEEITTHRQNDITKGEPVIEIEEHREIKTKRRKYRELDNTNHYIAEAKKFKIKKITKSFNMTLRSFSSMSSNILHIKNKINILN
jgi:hypothetical protein